MKEENKKDTSKKEKNKEENKNTQSFGKKSVIENKNTQSFDKKNIIENKKIQSLDKKVATKKIERKPMSDNDKKLLNIAFNILAVFCIAIFCIALTPKTFQNDTFYTIKVGQGIREWGIDGQDHYSFINLPYTYPHWLYDVIMSLLFDFLGGWTALYVSTMVLSCLLGILLYFTLKKVTKNSLISFVIALGQMFLMKDYIAARAQLVTFVLFVLTVLFIEKFLESGKKRYAVGLIIIPILIANIHSAVWPFYFVLFLPYIGEYIIRIILDAHIVHNVYKWITEFRIKRTNKILKKAPKESVAKYQTKVAELTKLQEENNSKFEITLTKRAEKRKRPFKLKIEKLDRVKWLILIMFICLFTGLLTPIGDMPYTYTLKIMQGNTTSNISEHLPLTLIDSKSTLFCLTLVIAILIFTDSKIRLRDLFFLAGLTLLALMSRRQVSMLVLFGGIVFARILTELLERFDKKGTKEVMNFMTSTIGEILTILFIFSISYFVYIPNQNQPYVDTGSYPVEAAEWIKENLDYKNIRMFNEYNYGSYLLFEDIPVFIDSRCDLYTPEFNGEKGEDGKYDGIDVFTDFINISSIATYYDTKFEQYDITHVMTKTNTKLNMLLSRDDGYTQIYKDDDFIIYERDTE